jgi:hypothetical protein
MKNSLPNHTTMKSYIPYSANTASNQGDLSLSMRLENTFTKQILQKFAVKVGTEKGCCVA